MLLIQLNEHTQSKKIYIFCNFLFTNSVKFDLIMLGRSTMIKDKLKELDIKITELAKYLQISRPTMYKYIECYDLGQEELVDKQIAKLFDYISKNDLIDKVNVINFILTSINGNNNVVTNKSNKFIKSVDLLYQKDPNSKKIKFIKKIITTDKFNVVIDYLLSIEPLISKKKRSPMESKMLKPYLEINKIQNIKEGK